MRFLLGRAWVYTLPETFPVGALTGKELEDLVDAAFFAFHPSYGRHISNAKNAGLVDALKQETPYRVAKQIVDIIRPERLEDFKTGAYVDRVRAASFRSGLLACGDIGIALQMAFEQRGGLPATLALWRRRPPRPWGRQMVQISPMPWKPSGRSLTW